MADAKQYEIILTGESPLLLHKDNLEFSEVVKKWQKAPENKELSQAGDDRSPAWTWIGCLYTDKKTVGIDADCVMSMLREGGAKLKTGRKTETYKKQTQYGLNLDVIQFQLFTNGQQVMWEDIKTMNGNNNFEEHMEFAEKHGFELFVKRARVGKAKHVRVRPLFRYWTAKGLLTVFDEEESGLTQEVLQRILDLSGKMVGLGDWRPGGPTPGSYGRFKAQVLPVNK